MHDYFIGIDGGASKTLGVLIDEHGQVLARARVGGAAIVGAPSTASCAVLAALKQRLCAEGAVAATAVTGIGLGLNGIDFADEYAVQHAELSACMAIPGAHLTLVNDGVGALWGAASAAHLAIVQYGSGFTTAYRSDYGDEQLFDHLDAGGMFDLRRALAVLVARMIDGRAAATALKAAALRHYDVQEESEYAELLFRGAITPERLATGQMLLFASWQAGDAAATRIVRLAAEDYACAACAMLARVGDALGQVAFGGGVIEHAPEAFFALLAQGVHAVYPGAIVIRPQLSPAHGAALMSAFHHGCSPVSLFERMLREEGDF